MSPRIIKKGDFVYRPSGSWTKSVHALLDFLNQAGFGAAPQPFGFDSEGCEIVSFIAGKVYHDFKVLPSSTLISAAQLLRRYHDLSALFLQNTNTSKFRWQLPVRYPQEVICHGDFAPYNVVIKQDQVVGIIDFDTCHPAPRLWDLAYAVYRWAPLSSYIKVNINLSKQITRARLFCDAYGLEEQARVRLLKMMIERLEVLIDFMFKEAKRNKIYQAHIDRGDHLLYQADIEYLKANFTVNHFFSGG